LLQRGSEFLVSRTKTFGHDDLPRRATHSRAAATATHARTFDSQVKLWEPVRPAERITGGGTGSADGTRSQSCSYPLSRVFAKQTPKAAIGPRIIHAAGPSTTLACGANDVRRDGLSARPHGHGALAEQICRPAREREPRVGLRDRVVERCGRDQEQAAPDRHRMQTTARAHVPRDEW